jgi:hypothetical protein
VAISRKCAILVQGTEVSGEFLGYASRNLSDNPSIPLNETVAVIRTDNGTLLEVAPHQIRFGVKDLLL